MSLFFSASSPPSLYSQGVLWHGLTRGLNNLSRFFFVFISSVIFHARKSDTIGRNNLVGKINIPVVW